LGLLVDRQTQKITVLASLEGGMDIEKVASETPDKIIKFGVDPLGTLSLQDCDSIAQQLNLTEMLQPNNFSQAFSTASTSRQSITPPPLPRPPACTCAFTTQILPPNSEQALLAALVLAIKTPLGVLILLRLNNVLA
jgi:hypothetical protein